MEIIKEKLSGNALENALEKQILYKRKKIMKNSFK